MRKLRSINVVQKIINIVHLSTKAKKILYFENKHVKSLGSKEKSVKLKRDYFQNNVFSLALVEKMYICIIL